MDDQPHCSICAKKEGDVIVERGELMVRLASVLKNGGEAWVCPVCDHPGLLEISSKNFPASDR